MTPAQGCVFWRPVLHHGRPAQGMVLIISSQADGYSCKPCLWMIPAFAVTGQGGGGAWLTGWLGSSFKSPVAPSKESEMRAFRGEDCSLGHLPCCPTACRAVSCPWVLVPGTGTLQVVAGSRPVSGTPLISLHCPRVQTDKPVSRSPPCMSSQRLCRLPRPPGGRGF